MKFKKVTCGECSKKPYKLDYPEKGGESRSIPAQLGRMQILSRLLWI